MMIKTKTANIGKFVAVSTLWIGAWMFPAVSQGLTFPLPADGNIIGNVKYTTVQYGETLSTLGRRYDMGGYEMKEANPGVSYSNPSPGTSILIPSRFILPDAPRKGIVINLAELRLYYYHPDGAQVSTFPVGVGQEGWNTPLGTTQVVRKRQNPSWHVPDSIMENELAHGISLQKVVPPGPTNPLGNYAITLGFDNIVIHGSPYPKGVGVRSSHGCIRMLNEDVVQLFQLVSVGTPVTIIHQPNKIGHMNDKIFLEAHVPISNSLYYSGYDSVGDLIHKVGKGKYQIEWGQVQKLKSRATGYPQPIGSLMKSAQSETIQIREMN